MGEVYQARDTTLERDVAIKILACHGRRRSGAHRAVPARGKNAGGPQSSEHRADLRFRAVGIAARSGHGARRRRGPRRAAHTRRVAAPRRTPACAPVDRGARSGACPRDHPPRSQARQHQGARRRHAQGARFRSRQGARGERVRAARHLANSPTMAASGGTWPE